MTSCGTRSTIFGQSKGIPHYVGDLLDIIYLVIMGNDDRIPLLFLIHRIRVINSFFSISLIPLYYPPESIMKRGASLSVTF